MQLTEDESLPLSTVVNYKLPMSEIVSRLSGRRTCQDCKSVFHVTGQPPKAEGLCDHCGGLLYQREDDRPESIAVRLDVYRSATAPLIEFYTDLGLLMPVAATGSPDTICARTIAALEARRVADHPMRSYSATLSPVRQER
jgi:adenylate kinase